MAATIRIHHRPTLLVATMNSMYRLPANPTQTLPADVADRLQKFKATLSDEVNEIDDIISLAKEGVSPVDGAVMFRGCT